MLHNYTATTTLRHLFVYLCLLAVVSAVDIVRYDRFKLIQVQAHTKNQVEYLSQLHDTTNLDFWTDPSLVRPTDILVDPLDYDRLMKGLYQHNFNVTVIHDDIQRLIEDLGQHPHSKRQVKLSFLQATEGFPTYTQIYQWLLNKVNTNNKIMSVSSIGRTFEERSTYLVKLGEPGVQKPAIWIDSGIHAREWLSVSTSINLIDTMINSYNARDPTVRKLLAKFDWYFLPVANPDGYVYSHTSGGRMWRKTRTPYNRAYGADPNRNFGYHWCTTGATKDQTKDSYCGPKAWSEKCVVNLKQTLEQLQPRLKVYMTIHTYGQMWFIPYAWSRQAYPADYGKQHQVAKAAVLDMAKATGAVYRLGRVPDLLYEASGSAMDWVKGTLGTPYVFGLELRPGIEAPYGFIAQAAQIKPSAREVWAGLKSVALSISSEFTMAG